MLKIYVLGQNITATIQINLSVFGRTTELKEQRILLQQSYYPHTFGLGKIYQSPTCRCYQHYLSIQTTIHNSILVHIRPKQKKAGQRIYSQYELLLELGWSK